VRFYDPDPVIGCRIRNIISSTPSFCELQNDRRRYPDLCEQMSKPLYSPDPM